MRARLVLVQAGANFKTQSVSLPRMQDPTVTASVEQRRQLGRVRGLFPVRSVIDKDEKVHLIHESLAICACAAGIFPDAQL